MDSTRCEASELQAIGLVAGTERRLGHSWPSRLPVIGDDSVTLRPLRLEDARSLFAMLSTEEVAKFISPPPSDPRGFERFIDWTRRESAAGRYAAFAIVPAGSDDAVGLVQVRQLDPGFSAAEWGIALGSAHWGTGLFPAVARLFLQFVFEEVGVYRLEGRAAVQNGRANGALRKIGAVQEGVLRRSLSCNGRYFDQILWSILADDWRERGMEARPSVH